MKTVQTKLNEYQDTETAPCQILNQWPWRVQLLPRLQASPVHILMDAFQILQFSNIKIVSIRASDVQSSAGVGVTSSFNAFPPS